jgi:hypothetical protein
MLDLEPIKTRVDAGAKALAVAGNVVLRYDDGCEGNPLDASTRLLIANAPADLAALIAEIERWSLDLYPALQDEPWKMKRERDKLKERVEELGGVAEHADFFPYLREMFDTHVELLTGRLAPTVAYVNDDGARAEFEVPDDFYGWLMGVRDSIPGQPAPSK